MAVEYIVTPILGAVIGYFTNWLAIKMIFKPYTEKRIFNIKVPFTPGLMPKERYILSKKVGNVISTQLLTEEVMANALISDDIHKNIASLVEKALNSLKDNDKSILEITNVAFENFNSDSNSNLVNILNTKLSDIIISTLTQAELQENLLDFIITNLENLLKFKAKDLPLDNIKSSLENILSDYGVKYIESADFETLISDSISSFNTKLNESTNTIGEIISDEADEKIKLILLDKIPVVSKLLLTLIKTPAIEEKLKTLITYLINENVSKFVTVFINPLKVSESIISSIEDYLSNEDNYLKTYETLTAYLTKVAELNVNELTSKIPDDYKSYPISELIVKTIRKFVTEDNISSILNSINQNILNLDDKNIYDILINIEPDIMNKLRAYLKAQITKTFNDEKLIMTIKNMISVQIDKIMNLKINDLSNKISDTSVITLKNIIIKVYDFIIKNTMIDILKAMNISKVIEDKINEFEIKEAEDIVLQVITKELRAITIIGGVLGFIIGLLPILMELVKI